MVLFCIYIDDILIQLSLAGVGHYIAFNGPITIAIRVRFEHDSATTLACARIRDRFEHSTRISGRRVLHVD